MKNKIVFSLMTLMLLGLGVYLLIPSSGFPQAPANSLKSTEPADTESVYRQAYFTNLSREELMAHYWQAFGGWGYQVVLPPEDSYSVIRDQTRSSYLEEIVRPGRENLYINAFVPTEPAEFIYRNGVLYLNKVTVRYVPSHPLVRITALSLVGIASYLLLKEYVAHS